MAKEYEIAFKLGAELESTFRQSFENAADSVDNLDRNLKDLNKSGGKSFDTSSKSARNFSKFLKGGLVAAASAATTAVTAIGTAAVAAFKSVDDFNDAMNQVQVSTGASAKEMEEIDEIAKSLYGQNLGENFDDLASAISTVRQITKQQGQELEDTTRSALLYRDVFGEDIAESIKATDTMMKQFGITSDQAYNLLAQGAQQGLDKSGELLDSANEYAPQFAAMGFSAAEMFDMFSTGLESGAFNLDKVGDAVKEFNIRATDGSKSTIEAFEALDMNAGEMMKTIGSGGPEAKEAFGEVVQAISSVQDPVKQNEIGFALMGTMFEDLETDVVAAMGSVNSQFDATKGTMDEIAEVKFDTIGQAWRGIGRQLQTGFLIPLGEKLLPYLEDFSTWAENKIPVIQAWFGRVSESVTAAFNSFTDSTYFAQLQNIFGGLVDLAMIVVEVFQANWPYIQDVVMNVVSTVQAVLSGLMTTLGGVIDLVVGVFTGDWQRAWEGVLGIFEGVFEALGGIVKGAMNSVINMVNVAIRAINSIRIDVPDWARNIPGVPDSIGLNISEIPTFADGGIATSPSIFGEAGPEIAIPLDNSRRSQDLLNVVNRMMGNSGGGGIVVQYSPNIKVQGGGSDVRRQVMDAEKDSRAEFEQWFRDMMQRQRRVSFSG